LAYHEAGHAVVGYAIGFQIERVSIVPNEASLGYCLYQDWDEEEAAADLNTSLMLALAGAVAEEIVMGAPSRAADERRALVLALSRGDSGARAAERVVEVRQHLARLLAAHWPVVKALAAALRKQRELDGAAAVAIMARAFRKTGIHGRRHANRCEGSCLTG
jgi:hypothetical protein